MIVKCVYCHGTGNYRFKEKLFSRDEYRRCPVCDGDKKIDVPDNAVVCPACMMEEESDSWRKASGRRGYSKEVCPRCSGTGYAKLKKYR